MEYVHVAVTIILGICAGVWSRTQFLAKARKDAEQKVAEQIKELSDRVEVIEREYISSKDLVASYDRLESRVMDGLSRLDLRLDELYKIMHRP